MRKCRSAIRDSCTNNAGKRLTLYTAFHKLYQLEMPSSLETALPGEQAPAKSRDSYRATKTKW
jgi:hypothetical protein